MRRRDPAGPYSAANVEVLTIAAISADCGRRAQSTHKLKPPEPSPNLGTGRGWTLRAERRSARRPYQVMVSAKYIGVFATQSEAETAYQDAAVIHGEVSVRDRMAASNVHETGDRT